MSVTTAWFTRGGKVPRERLLIAILLISVALNVCVIAGAAWSRFNAPEPLTAAERFRKLETSLNLNDQQRLAFEAHGAATQARMAKLRQNIEPVVEAAWAELSKPQPDKTVILQRYSEAADLWRASQREGLDATLALLATLNPDQRAKFIADERERRAAMRRRHAEESR